LAEQHVPRNDKLSQELRQAKAIGQLTLLVGSQKLRALWQSTEPLRSETVASAPPTPEPTTEPMTAPWPDYDTLSGSEVAKVLEGADESLRQQVFAYESATRGRRSILDALGAA
jgi:hypothetical protein